MTERNQILVGDIRRLLPTLPTDLVDCVISSPPYYALRNYGHRSQLGLEPNVGDWVANLRNVTNELGRVLKPTGTMWLNLGDSYSRHRRAGAPAKSLLAGPERLLLALIEDGWSLRNKIIWNKTNPMPSSAADRLTSSHEVIYLLTRSPRYFFDLDAIRQPHTSRRSRTSRRKTPDRRPNWAGPLAGSNSGLAKLQRKGLPGHPLGRNPGDCWRVGTAGDRHHHATFPLALVERPILAGCPERVCVGCGRPWARQRYRQLGHLAVRGSLAPSCNCQVDWRPGLVLDPFIGTGTTAVAAESFGRDWLGIELQPAFARAAQDRLGLARAKRAAQVAPGDGGDNEGEEVMHA